MAWPILFERAMTDYGWRATMIGWAVVMLVVIPPIAFLFLHRPPEVPTSFFRDGTADGPNRARPRQPIWKSPALEASQEPQSNRGEKCRTGNSNLFVGRGNSPFRFRNIRTPFQ